MKYYVCDGCKAEITRSDLHYVVHMQEVAWESGHRQSHYDLCENCHGHVMQILTEPATR